MVGVENPWKSKTLKSPPIGHFSEFSRRAQKRSQEALKLGEGSAYHASV